MMTVFAAHGARGVKLGFADGLPPIKTPNTLAKNSTKGDVCIGRQAFLRSRV